MVVVAPLRAGVLAWLAAAVTVTVILPRVLAAPGLSQDTAALSAEAEALSAAITAARGELGALQQVRSSSQPGAAGGESRVARLFLPRRKFAPKTCLAVTTTGGDNSSAALSEILELLRTTGDSLSAGQSAILAAIAGINTGGGGGGTCDLSTLEAGQTTIMAEIANILTELAQLDDIEALVQSAKDMILAGQAALATSISDLSTDIETAKTMILAGQAEILEDIETVISDIATLKSMLLDAIADLSTDIATLSTDLATAKTMILDAIAGIATDISDLSTLVESAKTMILAGQDTIIGLINGLTTQISTLETTITDRLTEIDTQLDTLEAGQQEICDKIEALDAKLDIIIDKLMEGTMCPDGSTPIEGQCFSLNTNAEDFDDAQAACETMGGTLATMTAANAATLYALADMASNDKVWIGLTAESGSWAWEDGADYASGFQDWPGGTEPSPAMMRCGEAVATSSTDGDWNDIPCTAAREFICAIPA